MRRTWLADRIAEALLPLALAAVGLALLLPSEETATRGDLVLAVLVLLTALGTCSCTGSPPSLEETRAPAIPSPERWTTFPRLPGTSSPAISLRSRSGSRSPSPWHSRQQCSTAARPDAQTAGALEPSIPTASFRHRSICSCRLSVLRFPLRMASKLNVRMSVERTANLELWPEEFQAWADGNRVALTPREFEVLMCLVPHGRAGRP
jgi:hypothetical protein